MDMKDESIPVTPGICKNQKIAKVQKIYNRCQIQNPCMQPVQKLALQAARIWSKCRKKAEFVANSASAKFLPKIRNDETFAFANTLCSDQLLCRKGNENKKCFTVLIS
jgi:hypothetical protein